MPCYGRMRVRTGLGMTRSVGSASRSAEDKRAAGGKFASGDNIMTITIKRLGETLGAAISVRPLE